METIGKLYVCVIIFSLLVLAASCGDNIEPVLPDAASQCEMYPDSWPPVPEERCDGVYQFNVHTCYWTCSTWGLDGGIAPQ